MQVEACPFCPRERPFVLMPDNVLLAGMAHLELDRRLSRPAGVLALEEVAEEALLQALAVARIEALPVSAAVGLEPFLRRGAVHEAFEVPARMQPHAAPVRRGEGWHLHLGPVGRARMARLV